VEKYYKLIDELNHGEIIREDDGGAWYIFSFGTDEWVPTLLFMRYTQAEDGLYKMYEELAEATALELVDARHKRFSEMEEIAKTLFNNLVDSEKKTQIEEILAQLPHFEGRITAYLDAVCKTGEIAPGDFFALGFSKRIVNSLEILNPIDLSVDNKLLAKQDSNAWHIIYAKMNLELDEIAKDTSRRGKKKFKVFEEKVLSW
jgi:hypothetical protein